MPTPVISGSGLYRPPHVITNAELVVAFNAYADLQNAKHAAAIAASLPRPCWNMLEPPMSGPRRVRETPVEPHQT